MYGVRGRKTLNVADVLPVAAGEAWLVVFELQAVAGFLPLELILVHLKCRKEGGVAVDAKVCPCEPGEAFAAPHAPGVHGDASAKDVLQP